MPRYFFHIRDGDSYIADERGTELPGPMAAQLEAKTRARSALVQGLIDGRPIDGQRFEVEEEFQGLQFLLAFKDALK